MKLCTSVYGKSIRSKTPLSNGEIFRVAPSVFAKCAHESRSSRYTFIPTIRILEGLRKEGFMPFYAVQSNSRDNSKHGFAKHMLRFRNEGSIEAEEANEVILINSSDGSTGAQAMAGAVRFACNNSIVYGSGITDIRVRHTGNIVDDVIEGVYEVVKDFDHMDSIREEMKLITLDTLDQLNLAQASAKMKWGNDKATHPIESDKLLKINRNADCRDDLWTVFNRVQENLIKGGVPGVRVDANGNRKRTTTRAVNGIAESIKLNKNLWTIAEAMAELKTGHKLLAHAA